MNPRFEQQPAPHRLEYEAGRVDAKLAGGDSATTPARTMPVASSALALACGTVGTAASLAILLGPWRRNADILWVALVVFTLPAFLHSLDCLAQLPGRRVARWTAALCSFPVLAAAVLFVCRLAR